ncbi:hypothetical protein OUZ56_008775 [Daphnia magna]|uniref:Uncharacterized protein n=1 Tax=Daphnia magna TaxID=35525 RepID=A0ABR0AE15_9CRUS|nr:hypothetical protein OUZ56_008775 [Daphnia magna]
MSATDAEVQDHSGVPKRRKQNGGLAESKWRNIRRNEHQNMASEYASLVESRYNRKDNERLILLNTPEGPPMINLAGILGS